jgi:hypothetical protein
MGMARDIIALLRLFEPHAADADSHARVVVLAANSSRWSEAHRLFDEVRRRWLAHPDSRRRGQYEFEEICLKALYNETAALDPFDPDSPYYVVPCAIGRARQVGVPVEQVLAVVAPQS